MKKSSELTSKQPSRLFRLLSRSRLFRKLWGGEWEKLHGSWVVVALQPEPSDITDNFCLRDELQEFLSLCEKENQRERT